MRCAAHPRYVPTRMPLKTAKNPDGCPTCWGIWERAKTDPKKALDTINIELTRDEARVLVLTLNRMMMLCRADHTDLTGKNPDKRAQNAARAREMEERVRLLQPFYLTIMRLVKGAL